MYLSFFGLNEKPFAITPDPRYLYLSERHAEALAHLLYGINEAGGFVQLTGEVGTGKTTIVRSLLAQTPKNAEIALILNPKMTAPEFLLTICEELGIGVPDAAMNSLKDLVDILSGYLLRAHAGGRRVVVVVDEAQNLAPTVLEQVRLLTNLETNTRKLLQIILIGQPELRDLLARNELRQLAQRITGRYHLNPLTHAETAAYVRHRLRVAGATSDIFSPTALSEVHRLATGVPRVINVVCDRALLGAYSTDRHRVTSNLVRQAAEEVFGKRFTPRWLPWLGGGAAAGLLAMTVALIWNLGPWSSKAHATSGTMASRSATGGGAGAFGEAGAEASRVANSGHGGTVNGGGGGPEGGRDGGGGFSGLNGSTGGRGGLNGSTGGLNGGTGGSGLNGGGGGLNGGGLTGANAGVAGRSANGAGAMAAGIGGVAGMAGGGTNLTADGASVGPISREPNSGAQTSAARGADGASPRPSGHELTQLLAAHASETDTDGAFTKLFGLWRIRYVPATVDPCTQASSRGLECLNQRGSFGQLRLYNRPAILILNDDAGTSHQVVLTALDDDHATIQLGGGTHDVSIGELSRYWFGDFIMLWRPGTSQVKSLAQGMRGDDVKWLRQSLQRVEGVHSEGPVSDLFDADLSKLVRDFQRQHRLTVDGIAGVQTQIVLASVVEPKDAPRLYLADAHGG